MSNPSNPYGLFSNSSTDGDISDVETNIGYALLLIAGVIFGTLFIRWCASGSHSCCKEHSSGNQPATNGHADPLLEPVSQTQTV